MNVFKLYLLLSAPYLIYCVLYTTYMIVMNQIIPDIYQMISTVHEHYLNYKLKIAYRVIK